MLVLSNPTAIPAPIPAFPASPSAQPAQLVMARRCVTLTPTHLSVSATKATTMMAPIKCAQLANILASLAAVRSPASLVPPTE